jgi:hypothetical protein
VNDERRRNEIGYDVKQNVGGMEFTGTVLSKDVNDFAFQGEDRYNSGML